MAELLYTRTAIGTRPIDLAKAKSWARIKSTTEDVINQDLLDSILDFAELYTNRELSQNTWKCVGSEFTDLECIRKNPVVSITSVKYFNEDNVETTVANTVYYLVKGKQISGILEQVDQDFPTDVLAQMNQITAIIVTGFATVPPTLLQAIKGHFLFLFENRGDVVAVDDLSLTPEIKALYDLNKIVRI